MTVFISMSMSFMSVFLKSEFAYELPIHCIITFYSFLTANYASLAILGIAFHQGTFCPIFSILSCCQDLSFHIIPRHVLTCFDTHRYVNNLESFGVVCTCERFWTKCFFVRKLNCRYGYSQWSWSLHSVSKKSSIPGVCECILDII